MANYIVQAGDTLTKIGSKTGVSWQSIASVNGIPSPYTIRAGQSLIIPTGGTNSGGANMNTGSGADFSPVLDKIIGGVLLYGIFRVLMKVF